MTCSGFVPHIIPAAVFVRSAANQCSGQIDQQQNQVNVSLFHGFVVLGLRVGAWVNFSIIASSMNFEIGVNGYLVFCSLIFSSRSVLIFTDSFVIIAIALVKLQSGIYTTK